MQLVPERGTRTPKARSVSVRSMRAYLHRQGFRLHPRGSLLADGRVYPREAGPEGRLRRLRGDAKAQEGQMMPQG